MTFVPSMPGMLSAKPSGLGIRPAEWSPPGVAVSIGGVEQSEAILAAP